MINCVINIRFFLFLRDIDLVLAKESKAQNCHHCGGILDVSNYLRKPRGIKETRDDDISHIRFSFCCRKCRKRMTPQSVRFLGRKVYVGMCVIFAMSAEWLQVTFTKICRQTLARWRRYWNGILCDSSRFWKKVKCQLPPNFQTNGSPVPIIELFLENDAKQEEVYSRILKFFSPLSVRGPSG